MDQGQQVEKDQQETEQQQETNQENQDDGEKIDLWEIASQMENKNADSKNKDRCIILVGEQSTGKSQLVEILKESRVEDIKPTSGVEYSCIKKSYNASQIISTYEVASGRSLSSMIQTFVNPQKIKNTSVFVVVDLSKPTKIMESLQFWFQQIREQTDNLLAQQPDQQKVSDYKFSLMQQLQDHPDRTRIDPLPIKTVVTGTKFDLYEKFDGEKRKWISRAIRYYAHLNGASVIFSGLQSNVQNQLRGSVSSLQFNPEDTFYQIEHLKPIYISFPQDQVAKIGFAGQTSSQTQILDDYQKKLESEFPQHQEEGKKKDIFVHYHKFTEQKIDSIKAEKDKEMERLSKKFLSSVTN